VADLPTGAELLIEAGGPATYVGYSMGARFCLHAALTEPASVRQLVLISGTAGIGSAADRAERRAADAQLADHIDEIGVDAFLREWLALPLFAGLSSEAADVDDRRRNTAAGLRSSLEHAGTGTQEPLWDRLDTLAMPVLVVAGSDDPKFRALAERMATAIGAHAELQVIAGAGHTVHLERPDQFLEALTDWLHRHGA
jgi:2-succinyl-6-hydroxy-2,4-cyclohexadiene-1-carboxylate synthase